MWLTVSVFQADFSQTPVSVEKMFNIAPARIIRQISDKNFPSHIREFFLKNNFDKTKNLQHLRMHSIQHTMFRLFGTVNNEKNKIF